jgi:hypothetical protein
MLWQASGEVKPARDGMRAIPSGHVDYEGQFRRLKTAQIHRRSAAKIAALAAIVPSMFMVVTGMIPVIKPFARFRHQACGAEDRECQQSAALQEELQMIHACSK